MRTEVYNFHLIDINTKNNPACEHAQSPPAAICGKDQVVRLSHNLNSASREPAGGSLYFRSWQLLG